MGLKGLCKDCGLFTKKNELLLVDSEHRSEGIPLSEVSLVASGEPQGNVHKLACSPVVPSSSRNVFSYPSPVPSAKMPKPGLMLSDAPEGPAPACQSSHAGLPSPILPWES